MTFALGGPNLELRLDHIGGPALERRDVSILGPDANLFDWVLAPSQVWRTLGAGQAERWWLRYSPVCSLPAPIDGWRHARVIVETDRGPLVVDLRGEYDDGR